VVGSGSESRKTVQAADLHLVQKTMPSGMADSTASKTRSKSKKNTVFSSIQHHT
jgi:hypothetical protein